MFGLIAALGAAVAYGAGSVLQGVGAGRSDKAEGVDPRLFVRLLRQVPFAIGLGLDAVGFGLALIALRTLALFVVQAAVACNLAVTAVLVAVVLGRRLTGREWSAVVAATVGLVLVGLSSGPEGLPSRESTAGWAVLAAAAALAGVATVVAAKVRAAGAGVLGAIAGLGFGIVAIAGRVIPAFHLGTLARSPALWGLVLSGAVAFVMWSNALQRGAITVATAAMVVGETLLPAAVGIAFLGDGARRGWAPVGTVGFVVAVGAALVLSRFGELEPETEPDLVKTSS